MSVQGKPDIQSVIDAVNKVRKRFGRRPIQNLKRGYRFSFCYCPIARSMGAGFGMCMDGGLRMLCFGLVQSKVKTPRILMEFARRFDFGEYPELELPEKD